MSVPATIRNFGKVGDALPIPDLIRVQRQAYSRFLQENLPPSRRKESGLQGILKEAFPIESYSGDITIEFLEYELGKPRYNPTECKELKLTYGKPLRVRLRMTRKEVGETVEEAIYLGEIPIMLGGGEFIINGATRVIVSQLHRSPGVDFVIESQDADRSLHAVRMIPERGSWIEINVTKREILAVRIDQSSKMPATTFLRALDAKYSSDADIIRTFYPTKTIPVTQLKAGMRTADSIIDPGTGEELLPAGEDIAGVLKKITASDLKQIEIIEKVSDPLILNTLSDDTARSHEEALLKIYTRLRPGNPPQLEKAKKMFAEKFFDYARYRLGRVGRFRINRKFNQDVSLDEMVLRPEDFVNSLKYILTLRSGEGELDDIDHLGNRRLRTIDELAVEELRKGMLKLRRTVQERISIKDPEQLKRISDIINSKAVSSAVDYFFGRGELSQVVDQTNPLSQLTHERRLSALGPGGLNRKRAGFEVRDVHISHYGRICPIETPEGTNIGLISSLAVYSSVDEYGFLLTPYRQVERGKVNGKLVHLRADEEMDAIIAPPDILQNNKLTSDMVLARVRGDLGMVEGKEVEYIDISPKQIVGISAALIPFLEHDDANRALMGSNMQRQAVPLIRTEPPIVGTGMESYISLNSGMVVKSQKSGTITYVDSERIVIDETDEYELAKFQGLNERTCLNQKPIVKEGERVKADQIIADGPGTTNGELSLGKNLLVAFMPFDGYNFEDAILVSERLLHDDVYTSIHIDDFSVEVRETKLGREEFTRDIPNVSERALKNLDERGIVQVGTRVKPGDILVGKVSPKSKTELTPEEKLLQAIFGRAGEDVKNDSLEVPSGIEGVVVGAKHFARKTAMSDDQKKEARKQITKLKASFNTKRVLVFRQMIVEINKLTGQTMVDPNTRQKVALSDIEEVISEQIDTFDIKWVKPAADRDRAQKIVNKYWPKIIDLQEQLEIEIAKLKRGAELPSGVLEMVKIYIATKRQLSVGDKMAGRHGNKGVIARIMPQEDMPFLEDGTPMDIVLNPLGVPSRMNVGQILETHLGWAASVLGFRAVTPVFDGATEEEIKQCLREAQEKKLEEKLELDPWNWLEKNQKKLRKKYLGQMEFKWISTEKNGKTLSEEELEALETKLMWEYPDKARNKDIPRYNKDSKTEEKIEKVWNSNLEAIFKETKKRIKEDKNWVQVKSLDITSNLEQADISNPLDNELDYQGIYFFRNRHTKSLEEGYIGLAGKKGGKSQSLKERLKKHHKGYYKASYGSKISDSTDNLLRMWFDEYKQELKNRMVAEDGKVVLYDGRTGEPFSEKVTVGQMYMMKLHHLVDDKIHARSTGPYSLITQQPLGGKARAGGQRFGEMEVWGLEAYGAAYILQEMLTVKSDDVEGRTKIYESMVKGSNSLEAGTPVSFEVLCNEIRGLALNVQMEKRRLI